MVAPEGQVKSPSPPPPSSMLVLHWQRVRLAQVLIAVGRACAFPADEARIADNGRDLFQSIKDIAFFPLAKSLGHRVRMKGCERARKASCGNNEYARERDRVRIY